MQGSVIETPCWSLRNIGGDFLAAFDEIAFEHHAGERRAAGGELVDHAVPDDALAAEIFVRVGVAAIDD